MQNKKTFIISLALIIGAAGIFFYNRPSETPSDDREQPKPELRTIKVISVKDSADSALLLDIARDKKIFAKYNLEVERMEPIGKLNDILLSGEADAAIMGIISPLPSYLNGAEPRLLANVFHNFGFFGLSRYSREDLKSVKKAAMNDFGKDGQVIMVTGLKKLGLDLANVELSAIPAIQGRIAALDAGKVDFIIIPSTEKAIADAGLDKKYHVFGPDEIISNSGLLYRSIITTTKSLENKREELREFVFAVHDALEYMSSHPDETRGYIREKYGFSDEQAKKFYNSFLKARENVSYIPEVVLAKNISNYIKIEFNLTGSDRNVADFVYPDFAKEALSLGAK